MSIYQVQFIGGAYTARSKDFNSQICQNYYVELDEMGSKNPIALIGCPGITTWLDTSNYTEVRNLHLFGDSLIAIVGDTVYLINTSKAITTLGTIGTSSGWVDIAFDGITMSIFDSTGGWTYDGTFSAITDADLPDVSGATFQDGYHIVTRANTDQFFISEQDDPTSWDATDFATAEASGDILVSPKSVKNQLWLFGKETTEVWYNSGETFPFNRNPGGILGIGCGSKRSIAVHEDSVFWLDNKYRVMMGMGIAARQVSPYQIDYQISQLTRKDNSVGFCYTQEGHSFYELSFPSDDKTFCYDISTGMWHMRASGALDLRSRANCSILFDDKVLVGDCENGKIYEYRLDVYDDDGEPKRAIRSGQPIHNKQRRLFCNYFEIDMETGVANTSVTDPQIMLQWSDDGGHTWSNEHWKSIGAVGKYGQRVKWNRLGYFRDRVFKTTISDAVKRNIINAFVEGTIEGTREDSVEDLSAKK